MELYATAIVVAITVLNIAVGISLEDPRLAASLYFLLPQFAAMMCGFLASKSRNVVVLLAETSYFVVAVLMRSRLEMLASLLFLYTIGAVSGLFKRRGSLEVGLGIPISYRPAMLSLGFSLIGAGIIGLVGIPLSTPVSAVLKRGASSELLVSVLVAYVVQAYISSLLPSMNLLILAPISLLTPYTLPILSILPTMDTRAWARLKTRRLRLGRVVEVIKGASFRDLAIPFERGLNRNIVVVGATGTGKSSLAKQLIYQLKSLEIPVIVFDPHGEYCGECVDCECVDASELSVDIFRVYEEDPKARAEFVADAISEIYSLGNLQRIALSKALTHMYGELRGGEAFDYLLDYLWRASHGEIDLGVPQPVVRSLIPYLERLKNTFRAGGRRIEEYVNSLTIVDYSKISSGVSTIIAEIVIDELYHTFKDSGRELILVVDEAQRFLGKGRALSRVFREGRKYGISSILITQDVGSIPRELLLNSASLISFSLPEIAAARYIARIVSPDDQALYEKVLSKLVSLPQFRALASVFGVGFYVIEIQVPYSSRRK